MLAVYEILVPTIYGDTRKPIGTRHHKSWDKFVRRLTGGLTLLAVAKGQWVNKDTKELFEERIIPVRIACHAEDINKLIDFTLFHYRQQAIMFYKVSDEVEIRYA